jgi:A/G-specific adenine glycosylase
MVPGCPAKNVVMTHPVTKKILRWYACHQRDLPWRRTSDPYAVWVSEIMLQQTQVQTVLPYYRRFLDRFPTVQSLAAASMDEVLKAWENLGYYSRARHLHAAAREIVKRRQGLLPSTEEELRLLPGIGSYTAAAIASIAYGKKVPALDGNVRRVLCRLFAVQEPLDQHWTQRRLRTLAEELIPAGDPGRFNQGLMDLGATVCTPRKPACSTCPLRTLCLAAIKGMQERLPAKKKQRPLPHKEMTAGILLDRRGRVLVVQRPAPGLLGGLWKFPGGTRNERESLQESLRRAAREELGVAVRCGKELAVVHHGYTHFTMTLRAYRCSIRNGTPRALKCRSLRWVMPQEFDDLPFSRADRKVMEALPFTTGRT